MIQIPELLSRQTPLLEAADETDCVINIKKGIFYSYNDIQYMIKKCPRALADNRLFVTERGSSFGYNDLVVDMRGIPVMREKVPVIFDATHSIQRPSAGDGESGGDSWLTPYLAKAAAMMGVDGLYTEVHPNPLEDGKCDSTIMYNLDKVEDLWKTIIEINKLNRSLEKRGDIKDLCSAIA
jgi:2-dehydro-3-deoxyphosphooctonate aldolase (KDO 8-P synthase)